MYKPELVQKPNYYWIDNPDKLHDKIKDFYIYNNLIVDEFNLTGIRYDMDQEKDWYNDLIIGWTFNKIVPVIGTTDPGRVYASTPLKGTRGVAHIQDGFYVKAYKLGYHNYSKPKFKHQAFVQVGNVKYWIDTNKNMTQ